MILFLFGLALGYLFSIAWVYLAATKYKIEKHFIKYSFFRKYHVHHSMFSVVFLTISPLLLKSPNAFALLLGISAGILLHHIVTEGFMFITQKKNCR